MEVLEAFLQPLPLPGDSLLVLPRTSARKSSEGKSRAAKELSLSGPVQMSLSGPKHSMVHNHIYQNLSPEFSHENMALGR